MGYSVNGIPLDNSTLGWEVLAESDPRGSTTRERVQLHAPGRDGHVPGIRGRTPAPRVPLKIKSPVQHVEKLKALLRTATTLGFDGPPEIEAVAEFVAVGARKIYENRTGSRYDVSALLELPNVYWRDVAESTSAAFPITSGSVEVPVFPGITAPVRDAIVRVAGGVTGLQLLGADGTFLTYAPNVPSGSFIRFDSATGQAWVTATDTWTGGTEVSGSVIATPGPYPFELDCSDVLDPIATFTVVTTVRSGSPSVQVRGRAAYDH